MFKTMAATAAAIILVSPVAMAAKAPLPKLTAGQYSTVQQYTGLTDLSGLCTPLITLGAVNQGEATVGALGTPTVPGGYLERSIANPTTPAQAAGGKAYAVGFISCDYQQQPLNTAFTAVKNGTVYTKEFTLAAVSNTTSCYGSNGISYTLQSGNGTLGDGTVQTQLYDIMPPVATLSSFKITTTNTALIVPLIGTNPICYIGTDTLFARSGK